MCVFKRGLYYHYDFTLRGRQFRGSTGQTGRTAALRHESNLRADLDPTNATLRKPFWKKKTYPTAYVYALSAPDDATVRYVGKTFDPKKRLNGHSTVTKKPGSPRLNKWIDELRQRGLKPTMTVLETVEWKEAGEAERRQIIRHIRFGCDLLNELT